MTHRRKYMLGSFALIVAASLMAVATFGAEKDGTMPAFEVDAAWPKLPNGWTLGQTPSVAVDRKDNVWILHRPRTAEGQNVKAAPAVVKLDAAGGFVNAWGGPGQGFDWPDSEHGILVELANVADV